MAIKEQESVSMQKKKNDELIAKYQVRVVHVISNNYMYWLFLVWNWWIIK